MGEIQNDLREIQMVGGATQQQIVALSAAHALGAHGIMLCGLSQARAGFRWVRQSPAVGVVLSCFEGQGQVLVSGQWQTCIAGMTYVTPARVLHAYHATENSAWGLCWVTYRAEAIPFSTPIPTVVHRDPHFLRSAVLGLYRESIGPAEAPYLFHWAELVHLETLRITGGVRQESRLWRLWEAVDAELVYPWSLADLAALARISQEHLRFLCRRELGRTPMQQVTALRMQRAAVLLHFSDDTIEAIARAVGYSNPYAFSTAFKRRFGLPPSRYRSTE